MTYNSGEARLDVIAYLRALMSGNTSDAAFVAKQALSTNGAEFVMQLSTLTATLLSLTAGALGTDPDTFMASLQASELSLQAGGE